MKSDQGKDFSFDWHVAGGDTETDKGDLYGRTGIMPEDDRFFVGVLIQLLLRREKEA